MNSEFTTQFLVELTTQEAATINGGRRGRGKDDGPGHGRRRDDGPGHQRRHDDGPGHR
jgi:hypothetical protein